MVYLSTRGQVPPCGFVQMFLAGLADDGGLYLPDRIPQVSATTLRAWQDLPYQELAWRVLAPFIGSEMPEAVTRRLIAQAYVGFSHPQVTPVVALGKGRKPLTLALSQGERGKADLYVLELFHGPTLSFKDLALQFIGPLYSWAAETTGERINILGATSGDTGAAAIHGVKGRPGIKIAILHPHGRVSKAQELQMTTVVSDNVLNLAVRGDFDDCQRIVKDLFADLEAKRRYSLRAINSVNLVRVLAQTVYYFYAYFRVDGGRQAPVYFSVPTGNFGDIFAGYLARRMGLPIARLILATNENNILERFVNSGVYQVSASRPTWSPAMDIQVASNFERYLYYLLGEDAPTLRSMMQRFREQGALWVDTEAVRATQGDFISRAVSNDQCLEVIRRYHENADYLVDPHTACGVGAWEAAADALEPGVPCICLATAHPGKFEEAVRKAGVPLEMPAALASLFGLPSRMQVIDNDRARAAQVLGEFYG